MIFYFTGTGNSEYVAKQLVKEGEQLISMGTARWEEDCSYTPAEGESVGFVFPVYFFGLPDTVRTFVKKLCFTTKPEYTYAVMTYAGGYAGAGALLDKYLQEKGVALQDVYAVKMPSNYVVMFDATSEEDEKPILTAAEERLKEIKAAIQSRPCEGVKADADAIAQTEAQYPTYDQLRTTAPFYTDDRCVGCGTCASRCPAKAIEMIDGTPTWVKDLCDHCMSCARCNAIQYGDNMLERYRYKHPSLRKKGHGSHGDGESHDCCCGGGNHEA